MLCPAGQHSIKQMLMTQVLVVVVVAILHCKYTPLQVQDLHSKLHLLSRTKDVIFVIHLIKLKASHNATGVMRNILMM